MARPPGRGPRAAEPLWRPDGLWLTLSLSCPTLYSSRPDPPRLLSCRLAARLSEGAQMLATPRPALTSRDDRVQGSIVMTRDSPCTIAFPSQPVLAVIPTTSFG
ncbi:hypothetical protein [Gluconobacter sp. OJB]|uniref:hypothetical protein n=1 Tax=unclassified Gluconobacter TaxID=2644261 RepID=UPI0031F9FA80